MTHTSKLSSYPFQIWLQFRDRQAGNHIFYHSDKYIDAGVRKQDDITYLFPNQVIAADFMKDIILHGVHYAELTKRKRSWA